MQQDELVRACDAMRELDMASANFYSALWRGRLRATQDPQTRAWTIKHSDLEEFKRRRERKATAR